MTLCEEKRHITGRRAFVLFSFLLAGIIFLHVSVDQAIAKDGRMGYLALGADLTDDELEVVLDELGVDQEELDQYDVVYITNEEEHAYLGNYVDEDRIGSRALSSVLIEDADEGSGITVDVSDYVTYCTEGMYENALVTAGIEDVDVSVAGPFDVSGTAALVGAIKAYSSLTGETIEEAVVDAAIDEIVTTGELENSLDVDNATVEGMVAYLKQEVAEGNVDDIDAAINEAADQFGVSLTDAQKSRLSALLEKLSQLDLDPKSITEQAYEMVDKLRGMGIDFSDLSFHDMDTSTAKGFLEKILGFILGLLGRR